MYLFKDILGQDSAVSFLAGRVKSGRLANAYLFHGPGGVGKRLAAVCFAKAINCLSRDTANDRADSSDPADGCGICPACKKIEAMNHPDVRVVSSGSDGSSVKIDDVRAVIADIGLKPYEARMKVYIIDGADNLTEEAANALLKTIEEPAGDSLLVLISESPRRLLPTVRSRCQNVRFFPMGANIVKDILVGRHGIDADIAHILAGITCGSPGEALKLKDDDLFDRRERVIKALSSGALPELEFDKRSRSELRALLNIMMIWYRDILVTKAGNSNIVNIDKEDLVRAEAKRHGFIRLNNAITKIISTQIYLEQNANPRIAIAALGTSI